MNDTNFGCCSRYQQCSDQNKCINIDLMNNCDYWLKNLSKGINFYSNKSSYLYLIIDNRAFKISKASERNYSYSIETDINNKLCKELISSKIQYSIDCSKYGCSITGCNNKPAHFRVNFKLENMLFNIKNFNGYEITEDEARLIKNTLPEDWQPEVINLITNEHVKVAAAPKVDNIVNIVDKVQRAKIVAQNHQISMFEMLGEC